jgi:hypothetical protein
VRGTHGSRKPVAGDGFQEKADAVAESSAKESLEEAIQRRKVDELFVRRKHPPIH